MNSKKLKKCPFCGGEAEILQRGAMSTSIRCKDCGCRTGECAYEDAAIFNWNKRVCVSSKPERLDTNGSCTEKSYSCEEIETMRKKLEYYEADAGGASVADLLAENRRLREGLPPLFDSTPKPTYKELKKMVKPLEWKDDGIDVSRANITPFLYFKVLVYGYCYLVRLNENGHFLHSIGIVEDGEKSLDAQKQNAQKWLVDLVAAALGVERSGK